MIAEVQAQPRGIQLPGAPTVALHIDELVLHGFRPADRYAIAAAIGRELDRMLGAEGLPAALVQGDRGVNGIDAYRLDAGSFAVPHDAAPEAVGVQVARAVHRGLAAAAGSSQGADHASHLPGPGGVGR
jgi:hypothetical protein